MGRPRRRGPSQASDGAGLRKAVGATQSLSSSFPSHGRLTDSTPSAGGGDGNPYRLRTPRPREPSPRAPYLFVESSRVQEGFPRHDSWMPAPWCRAIHRIDSLAPSDAIFARTRSACRSAVGSETSVSYAASLRTSSPYARPSLESIGFFALRRLIRNIRARVVGASRGDLPEVPIRRGERPRSFRSRQPCGEKPLPSAAVVNTP